MNPKMKSAIEKITLNDATFSNEVIEPTYVNFFYGKNGAGKSTIARTFKASDFDRYFAVDREMLFKFLEDTQHETMEYLRKIYKSDLEETIVSFINAETTKTRGSLLDVLKHGRAI